MSDADRIITVERGWVIELVSHNELPAKDNGLYKTSTELQFKA